MRILFIPLLLLAIIQSSFAQKNLKILNFQGDNGFKHESKDEALKLIEDLGTKNSWKVTTIANASDLKATDIATFDVIVFNNNCGNDGRILSSEQQQALKKYISEGGGFVAIHCAGAIWKEEGNFQQWYEQLVGTKLLSHPQVQEAKLFVENNNHISTQHLEKEWIIKDEWHKFAYNPRENVNVLLSVDENTYQGDSSNKMGGDHPFTWYQYYDGGRSFFTSLGHTEEIYKNSDFQKLIEGGILWAAKKATKSAVINNGLILDLDADKAVMIQDSNRVIKWTNQVSDFTAQDFTINNYGLRLSKLDSGRPLLKTKVPELNGHNTLVFEEDELINNDEDAFDHLLKGGGYTWFAVIKPYITPKGNTEFGLHRLEDVNAFMGNLKNGGLYEGFWGAFNDDLTVWCGTRNGITMGRFDKNNPKIEGLKLKPNEYYIVASRMGAGLKNVQIRLYINQLKQVYTGEYIVNTNVNPSKLAIGTERDATNHPGTESFDGEIARILLYERPLSDVEIDKTLEQLKELYHIK